MNRRRMASVGVLMLVLGLTGADIPPPKPAANLGGPLSVYRAKDAFDPDRRPFTLFGTPVMITQIHERLVTEFIQRPGAGIGRIAPPPRTPPEWVELVRESLSAEAEPDAAGKAKSPHYDQLKETLVLVDGTKRTVRERVWQLRDQRLMSVNAKGGPAVYLQDSTVEHDVMKAKPVATSKNTPTRKLDDFEARALAELREGNDVVLQSSATEMHVLGAIRARGECLECHKTKEGDLLGAFTYALALQSDATPEAECLKDTTGLPRSVVGAVQFVESLGGKVVRPKGESVREVYYTHTWTQNSEKRTKEDWNKGIYRPIRARLKNSALDVLESFPDLRVLDISHSMVTDDGFKQLAKLKTLQKVLYSPGYITDGAVAELKKALPNCTIEKAPELAWAMAP